LDPLFPVLSFFVDVRGAGLGPYQQTHNKHIKHTTNTQQTQTLTAPGQDIFVHKAAVEIDKSTGAGLSTLPKT
jgi:hypothetical protein